MAIYRLSAPALRKLLGGNVLEDGTCVIKFYSSNCHLCHALKDTYEKVSNNYEDLHFFAFNINDDPKIPTKLKFKGVPMISLVKVSKGVSPEVKKIGDPVKPHKQTWYTAEDITEFIEKEK
jgi:thiol-disulfide isomerase/thioredoxin|tara:strand:+ start:980 stop:1342 length:363 start_codon:yes stop_codon:yes gene_type:complete